ncbi:hypothetical protein [Bacillus sp. 1006-3]|uniref:hypothetical protein n=1 Tax=Bacillus sp. 1006-3 TaxID=2922309 RepID=UPI001F0F7DD4|nr:hypothetical protein [Bacillus sp. 1006-3]MCH4866798.1 hypothetical protein [Bacillus sp. 1006-3]
MAKWQDQVERKLNTQYQKSKWAYKVLVDLFNKYKVDFVEEFRICSWSAKDQEEFKRAMHIYGYGDLIKRYE